MKTLRNLFIILAATAFLFSSCKPKAGNADLVQAIPDSVVFVASFEGKQLVDKGELNKIKEMNLYQLLNKELDGEKQAKWLDEFVTDTRTSGLNLDQFYIYGLSNKNASDYGDIKFDVVCLFKMDNVKTFESKWKELNEANGGDLDEVQDKGDYKLLQLDGTSQMMWNNDVLLMVKSSTWYDEEEEMDYAFLLPSADKKSITANEDFASFINAKHDIGFWASYGQFLDVFNPVAAAMGMDMKSLMIVDMSKAYIHGALNFNNGEVKATGIVNPKSVIDEMLKQYPVLKKDFDSDLLKYFPEKSYTTMKMSINVQEYVRLMKDQLAKVANAQDKSDDDYGYDPMAEVNEIFNDPKFQTITNGLGGDAVLSLYDFAQGMIPMPMASLVFTVKNKETFDAIVSLIPSEIIKKQDKFYSFSSGPMTFGYLAFKDNKVCATTDEKAINAFLDKGFEKNLNDSPLASNLKSDFFFWHINLDLATYPDHITMMMRNQMGEYYKIMQSFMSIYNNMDYRATKDYEGEIAVKMKSSDANSLKVILKNIDENLPMVLGGM